MNMSYRGWNSTIDVQEDLRRVGQHGLAHTLHMGHVVVGEQPPPQPANMLDEEAELQMRALCGVRTPKIHNGVVKPDVAGISRLLRMIDGPDDKLPEKQEIKEEPQKEQTVNEVVVISKLNPNCKEFIPRFNVSNKTEAKEKEATKKTDECVPMILDTDQIDINEKAKKEKEALEKKIKDKYLRKKIIDTSNTVCPKTTKDRNVAILSLLKLHSHNPSSANNNTNDSIGKQEEVQKSKGDGHVATMTVPLLKTPAYYEKCSDELTPPKCFEAKPARIVSSALIEKVTNDDRLATYVEESVNKVQKWLQDTTNSSEDNVVQEINLDEIQIDAKEKGMNVDETLIDAKEEEKKKAMTPKKQKISIHLGPVTFKRKNLPASPSCSVKSDTAEDQKSKKEKCEEFKPSEYAEQLARKYAANNIDKEAEQGNILTWKIHVELKAREERLSRQRALAQAGLELEGQKQMDEAANTCVAS